VLVFLPYVQQGIQAVTQANLGEPVMPPPGASATVPSSPVPVETVSGPAAAMPAEPASASGAVSTAAGPNPAPDQAAVPASPAAPAQAGTAAAVGPGPAPSGAAVTVGQVPATGANNAGGVVAFRTKGQSWVQVTDATGTVVFRKLMESGETAAVNGRLPLAITVGSVQATEVEVRGKPYNLAPVSKDNVARFEVK